MVLRAVPGRYRLATEVLFERLTGRLEEELLMLGALTSARGTAVDIGANRGYYSYVMAGVFSRVVAFEPNAVLTANLSRYGAPHVTIHHCALSSTDGPLQLHLPSRDGQLCDGWASVEPLTSSEWDGIEVAQVAGRRLDDFGLRNVSLIKMDVEGHEVATLEGSVRTVEVNRPVVIIEVKPPNREAVDNFFRTLGFVPHVASNGRLQPIRDGLQHYEGPKDTFVFTPGALHAQQV
jgi:FkbM family methyltransferase